VTSERRRENRFTMKRKNFGYLVLILAINIAAVWFFLGRLDVSPAIAAGRTGIWSLQQQPPEAAIGISIFFTESQQTISDLSGNVIGEGEHGGDLKCVLDNCSQRTNLFITGVSINAEIEYKFTTLEAIDLLARRVVVAGDGKIIDQGKKERFQFTFTIQDNQDGTLSVRYEASRPDASIILRTPGWMHLQP